MYEDAWCVNPATTVLFVTSYCDSTAINLFLTYIYKVPRSIYTVKVLKSTF
jgi:hypothetical protein